MIAGLPWTAWLLISASTLPALTMVLAFFLAHRDPDARDTDLQRRRRS